MISRKDENAVATLTLNSNAANSVDLNVCGEFEKILDQLEKDRSIKVVILTGNSGFFSNGFEPTGFVNQSDEKVAELLRRAFQISYRLYCLPQITIAAINGHAMGVGAIWAVHMNYRIAVSKVRIGFPEALIGLAIPSAPAFLLQALVGPQKCRDLSFEGTGLKSEAAKEIGLVDEVVAADDLHNSAAKLAKKFLGTPFDVIAGNQLSTKAPYSELLQRLVEKDVEMGVSLVKSPNGQEGLSSILEKRRPVFKD
ncbi:MAG: enoyl-CoA hydratase/isomerase family protein [Leptospiraceae bacterium]|nr:enoyl-CoA hydratase/isomerase family protein [Leptospiraceae bacterium]